ncbi:hypothetical protein DWB61_17530 [Ancylomarina euxinus]|uniref:Lipoprotein n=1 Tax=Ancylomarina euxinus TaxID=2283627 RepID=A0A425XWE3_9BACT|nr:hypothetical protein [Ancylomarina euxinus]MCZ4696464.1 hypothetical protein [Ancylomarina euxinus]MUP16826.1 hypothetical protein [Ancylomarina euxinus]RRG18955.1 hypothetical protein DWB61_17530 [Ancylomarina euxinus]
MKFLSALIIFLVLFSCKSNEENRFNYIYNTYKYFRLGNELSELRGMSYRTLDCTFESDTLLIYDIIIDSTYHMEDSLIEKKNYSYELKIKFNKDELKRSILYFNNQEDGIIFKLKYLKNQLINGHKYTIYRFSTDFIGTAYPESIFYCKEFGIIGQYAYERGSMDLLSEISGLKNKDYLKISEKIIDDTIFLFSAN